MRVGWWVWVIAGYVLNEIVQAGGLRGTFTIAGTVITSTVTFLGAVGTGILLFGTAVFFWWLGRIGAEDGAARYDMGRPSASSTASPASCCAAPGRRGSARPTYPPTSR